MEYYAPAPMIVLCLEMSCLRETERLHLNANTSNLSGCATLSMSIWTLFVVLSLQIGCLAQVTVIYQLVQSEIVTAQQQPQPQQQNNHNCSWVETK